MNRRVFFWGLYDFANSLLFIIFIFYFPQWLVIEQGKPAWWFNGALIAASTLFIISTPFAASRIDRGRRKIPGLRFWTSLSLTLFLALSLTALFLSELSVAILVLYTLGMYAYLMCFLYFTPMLNDLSVSASRGRVSGIGLLFNFSGQVLGLLITIPLVTGALSFFGASPRVETFLPAVALMGFFALPMLLAYREPYVESRKLLPAAQSSLKPFLNAIFSNKLLLTFLIAYFFFSDALLTFSSNFSLYLETVYGTPDAVKAMLSASILALGAIGGFLFGIIADRRGLKRVLTGLLLFWVALFIAAASIRDFQIMLPLFLLGGFLYGPVWSISRAIIGQMAKKDFVAAPFSAYIVVERFASLLGPALWSGVLIVAGEGSQGYQWAIFSMGLLVLFGLATLLRVPHVLVAPEPVRVQDKLAQIEPKEG